jgi:hypothetical protein
METTTATPRVVEEKSHELCAYQGYGRMKMAREFQEFERKRREKKIVIPRHPREWIFPMISGMSVDGLQTALAELDIEVQFRPETLKLSDVVNKAMCPNRDGSYMLRCERTIEVPRGPDLELKHLTSPMSVEEWLMLVLAANAGLSKLHLDTKRNTHFSVSVGPNAATILGGTSAGVHPARRQVIIIGDTTDQRSASIAYPRFVSRIKVA